MEQLARTKSSTENRDDAVEPYRRPEVVDLGKASDLLQGGSRMGGDNFNQTQY